MRRAPPCPLCPSPPLFRSRGTGGPAPFSGGWGSALDGAGHDPADDLPSEQQEDDDDGQRADEGAGHDDRRVRDVAAAEVVQRDLDRGVGGVQRDDRPEEVVPGRHEREHPEDRHPLPGDRQDDAPEGPQRGGAVHPGRLDELVGQRLEEVLPHEEHPERGDEGRQDDRGEPPREVELGHDHVEGHDAEGGRDHHRPDGDPEERLLRPEAELGEGEAGEGAEQQRGDGDRAGDDDRVDDGAADVLLAERRLDVRPEVGAGGERRRGLDHLRHRPARRDEHVVEGSDEQDGGAGEDGVGEPSGGVVAAATPPAGRLERGAGQDGRPGDRRHRSSPSVRRWAVRSRTTAVLTRTSTTMSTKVTQATAAARPRLPYCQPCWYMNNPTVWYWLTAPPLGTPPPKSSGSPNSWVAPIVETTTVKRMVGRSPGRVM